MAEFLPDAATRTAHSLDQSGIKHPVITRMIDQLGPHLRACREQLAKLD